MGKRREVIVGEVFGKLTVLEDLGLKPGTSIGQLRLRCECGNEVVAPKGAIYSSENTRSCGCARRETLSRIMTTHGMRQHPLYNAWADMRKRCHNPNSKSYGNYGGRGIEICERWSEFPNFVADMGDKPYPEATLDREDTNGNYCPENCKWSSKLEQVLNQRRSLVYVYKGVTYQMPELVKLAGLNGIKPTTLKLRLGRGWSVERAVDHPTELVGWHKKPEDSRTREGVKLLYPR